MFKRFAKGKTSPSEIAAFTILSVFLLCPVMAAAESLDIYFIDVEGGAATLIVTPRHEVILIDCGSKMDDSRDLKRILHVAKLAGISRIDHLVVSHFHGDHFGPILQLSQALPIGHFYDHGLMQPNQEYDKDLYPDYQKASQGKRQVLHPGDSIPLKKANVPLRLICVVSDRKIISTPVGVGAGLNPFCDVSAKPVDTSDNARSIGLMLSYGEFDFLDLGDLTWNVEHQLVCPNNPLGKVDLYMVTHHGLNLSSNPALVKVIEPTVSILCNGPHKGANAEVLSLLKSVPSLKATYQLHRNVELSEKENPDRSQIANWDENCNGEFIKVSVFPDTKTFSVTIGEKGQITQYATK
jgi:competence protein ComEC